MSSTEAAETALVALVPEVESLVQPFRQRYDPSAADGMPAHITILYPFKRLEDIDASTLAGLGRLFQSVPGFPFKLAAARRFPGVLYLAPEPDQPFRELIDKVSQQFPETPPYGGVFEDVIPHLTVADLGDGGQLAGVVAEFQGAAVGRLPVRSAVHDVVLMEKRAGRWATWQRFGLG